MKTNYKRIYDAIKGKDYASKVNSYKSALSSSKAKLTTVQSIVESSQWIEKGLEIVKGSIIPSLKAQIIQLERGIDALSQAVSKSTELVKELEALEKLDDEEKNIVKWWYSLDNEGKTNNSEDYRNKIADVEKRISTQDELVGSIILSINEISFVYNDISTNYNKTVGELKDIIKSNSSGVLSYTPGTFYAPGREVNVLGRAATLLDVVCDGESLGQDGTIVIKKGTTVHLKVKVPDELKNVSSIRRTSADGTRGENGEILWKNWVSQECNPNVNRYDSSTWVNQREYDWYITGEEETDNLSVSQTAFFTVPGGDLDTYKGMVRVNVKVVA